MEKGNLGKYQLVQDTCAGCLDRDGEHIKLGLFTGLITKVGNTNDKGYTAYSVRCRSYDTPLNYNDKSFFITSKHQFKEGDLVAIDVINWRNNETGKYNMFLSLIAPPTEENF